jgi:hypothetical protein
VQQAYQFWEKRSASLATGLAALEAKFRELLGTPPNASKMYAVQTGSLQRRYAVDRGTTDARLGTDEAGGVSRCYRCGFAV